MRDVLASLTKMTVAVAFGVAVGLLALAPRAEAANPLELNFWLSGPNYEGRVADCELALPTISSQFQEKESSFWNSALAITGYARIRETAFRPWRSDNMPRRFCSAVHARDRTASDPGFARVLRAAQALLAHNPAVSKVAPVSISATPHGDLRPARRPTRTPWCARPTSSRARSRGRGRECRST